MSCEPLVEPRFLCRISQDDYGRNLKALLPPGAAHRTPKHSNLHKLFGVALAKPFAALHNRICDLLDELFPCTADEAIPEWQQVFGLGAGDCVTPEYACWLGEEPAKALIQTDVCVRAKLVFNGDFDWFALAAEFGIEVEVIDDGSAGWTSSADPNCAHANHLPRLIQPPCGGGLFADCGMVDTSGCETELDPNGCLANPQDPCDVLFEAVADGPVGGFAGGSGWCPPYLPASFDADCSCGPAVVLKILSTPEPVEGTADCMVAGQPTCFIPGMAQFVCLAQALKPAHLCLRFI